MTLEDVEFHGGRNGVFANLGATETLDINGGRFASNSDAGLRIGIVCDVGLTGSPTLLAHLEHHGLADHFDHWSFSDVVGVYKPAPEIFAHAPTSSRDERKLAWIFFASALCCSTSSKTSAAASPKLS